MSFSLNRIELIGNVGKDPETRFTSNNTEIMTFTLATTSSYKGKDGNWVNETTWHNIKQFSPSDYAKNNIRKGSKLYIEGRLTKNQYTDKENNKREFVEVFVNSIVFLEGRDSSGGSFTSNNSAKPTEPQMPDTPQEDLPF